MKTTRRTLVLSALIIIFAIPALAGNYFALCEGNYGQANSSLWSFNESISSIDGPLVWNTSTNPLGDVGQSLTLFDHKLYIIMNNSHEIRILDLANNNEHLGDIELPSASPRYMAVQPSLERGFVSSWNVGGLLIIDLNTDTTVDTLLLGGLPEQLLIDGDDLFVSMIMHPDLSSNNQILRLDISTVSPHVIESYEVVPGPGSMALSNGFLYVTSIYYNDAWESFSGTSRIDIATGAVLSVDHGYYTNYSADIDIIHETAYRIYGNSIVPLNDDLSFNTSGSIGNTADLYSFSIQNEMLILGTSDFVAPDQILVYAPDGSSQGILTLGALPGDVIYYDPDVVSLDESHLVPAAFVLGNNYPNPFNGTTSIPFQLPEAGYTSLNIFDAQGRLVNSLLNADLGQGKHEFSWYGTNASGKIVPSGIYFAVLRSGSDRSIIKLNMIK
ncbi:MAG: FlgD immunoglobulin-like domain containing protein [Candidatus Marinimicrobia bacterium]|nr:FlgD immunoglobulin-like domain containing protein [Candidatus Neomarinimicrobiota bacterium]